MRLLIVFFVLVLQHQYTRAQYYMLGEDRANQKWFRIETEHFSFVFPESFLSRAQTLANQSEQYYAAITQSIHWSPKKIPILIHTGGVVANAYSLWTPERAEYFMTPNQNNYSQNWLLQLIIHEDRHLIQMDKLNQGLTKILQVPFGQQSTALTLGLFMPMWYMEGDAVTTETAFSESGRGRMPSFEMKMKAQVLTEGIYNFEKASLGSYRDYVPDQYYFGYYFVSQSRKYYGEALWDNAIRNSARNWYMMNPLSNSFKKQTGLNKKQLYRKFFLDLKDQWLMQAMKTPSVNYHCIPLPKQKVQTHYKFARWINDSTLLAEKSGMGLYARFVSVNIRSGEEKTICKAGFYASEELPALDVIPVLGNSPGAWTTDNLSLEKNRFVWAEKKLHPRWEHVSYSVIMMHDLELGKTTQITHGSRYFSPVLSPDAGRIAAISFSEQGVCSLDILDAASGALLNSYPLPEGSFAMTPAFSPDGRKIACITQHPDLKGIDVLDQEYGLWSNLLPASGADITNVVWDENGLFFNASFSGIDNVFRIDPNNGKTEQVTFDEFGGYNISFSPDGTRYVFSAYTNSGFILKSGLSKELKPLSLDSIHENNIDLTRFYVEQEKPYFPDSSWKDSLYQVEKYRRGLHLFHVHSWLPVSVNTDNYALMPGVSFSSQNLLSTSVLTGGYEYLTQEETGRFYGSYSYTGWYPVLTIDGAFGTRHGLAQVDEFSDGLFTWKESSAGITLALPLHTTVRDFFQLYDVSASMRAYDIEAYVPGPPYAPDGSAFSFEAEAEIVNRQKTVLRDLQPRWGQDVTVDFRKSIGSGIDLGQQWTTTARLFFPGFFPHQGLKIEGSAFAQEGGSFSFTRRYIMPRGYDVVPARKAWRAGINYRMPLAYPDLNVGSFLYFKRLKGNFFFDYGEAYLNGNKAVLSSTGAEITCDTHVFRFFIPLDLGLRYAYLPRTGEHRTEFLLGINFSGF